MAPIDLPGENLLFGGLLTALVVAIAVIDFRHLIIPDPLNGALALGGLTFQAWHDPDRLIIAMGFSAMAVALLLLIRDLFSRLRGVTGLGLGDVKMVGAGALWISPWHLAPMLLIATVSALCFVIIARLIGVAVDIRARIPFGPFLGLGILVVWLVERDASFV